MTDPPTSVMHPASTTIGGLGFLVDRIARSLSRAFADVLAPFDLSATGLGVLSALIAWGPMTQSELAAFLGVERQQALHLVDALSRRELVTRRARESDRRVWDVTITQAGRELRDHALVPVRAHERAVFSILGVDEREHLARLLQALAPAGRYPSVLQAPTRTRG